MNENNDNKFIEEDEQMARILKILNDIPEQTLPETLESRLKEALHEEGEKIRALKAAAEQKTKKRKMIFRSLSTLAACLVVGVFTVSMYHNMNVDLPADETELQPMAMAYTEEASTDTSDVTEDSMADEALSYGAYGADEQGDLGSGLYTEELKAKSFASDSTLPESRSSVTTRDALGTETTEEESVTTYMMLAPTDPNLELIKEYLKTDQFIVVPKESEETALAASPATTGDAIEAEETPKEAIYEILLNVTEEGITTEKTLILIVKEGEVYEQTPAE